MRYQSTFNGEHQCFYCDNKIKYKFIINSEHENTGLYQVHQGLPSTEVFFINKNIVQLDISCKNCQNINRINREISKQKI